MFIQIQEKIKQVKEKKLKVLDLSYDCDREEQKLEKIPTEIFDLKQLEYLSLRGHSLKKIPKKLIILLICNIWIYHQIN